MDERIEHGPQREAPCERKGGKEGDGKTEGDRAEGDDERKADGGPLVRG
jgi:hypothetical protein